jgi:hypothetical protein
MTVKGRLRGTSRRGKGKEEGDGGQYDKSTYMYIYMKIT